MHGRPLSRLGHHAPGWSRHQGGQRPRGPQSHHPSGALWLPAARPGGAPDSEKPSPRDEDFRQPNTAIPPGSWKRGTYLNADRAGQPTKGRFCPPGEGHAADAGPGSARSQARQKGLLEQRCSLPQALKRPSGASRRASWRQLLRPWQQGARCP